MTEIVLSEGLIDLDNLNGDTKSTNEPIKANKPNHPTAKVHKGIVLGADELDSILTNFEDIEPTKDTSNKPLSDADIQRHTELTISISRWLTHPSFEEYLKKLGFLINQNQLHQMSIDELDEHLKRIKTAVNNKSTISIVKGGAHLCIKTMEGLSQLPRVKPHFDLNGWYESLQHNEEFDDILSQLELEYGMVTMLSPEKRLALLLLKTSVTVAGTNKVKARLAMMHQTNSVPEPIIPEQRPEVTV
jgi:hypothetical protein